MMVTLHSLFSPLSIYSWLYFPATSFSLPSKPNRGNNIVSEMSWCYPLQPVCLPLLWSELLCGQTGCISPLVSDGEGGGNSDIGQCGFSFCRFYIDDLPSHLMMYTSNTGRCWWSCSSFRSTTVNLMLGFLLFKWAVNSFLHFVLLDYLHYIIHVSEPGWRVDLTQTTLKGLFLKLFTKDVTSSRADRTAHR